MNVSFYHSMAKNQSDTHRYNQILDEALEMKPGEWESFIIKACGTDIALRDRILDVVAQFSSVPPDSFLEPPSHIREVTDSMIRRLWKKE